MTTAPDDLGRALKTPPKPGSTTDYERARLLQMAAPNTMNAWTHVIPLFAKLRRTLGKKTLFGRDKAVKPLKDVAKGLRLVVLGLYADGMLDRGESEDACLLEVTKSLLSFKEVYPNWTDAYLSAADMLVDRRETVLLLIRAHQESVEIELVERGICKGPSS